MALRSSSPIRNRLLAALSPDDYALLEPMLERVPLPLATVLIEAHEPIRHVIFPESGFTSTVANTSEGRIEVGLIGREGLVGVPVVLGTDRAPHTYMVQGAGEGLRIRSRDLMTALADRPSIFRPFGLFTQSLIIQIAETAHANVTFDIEGRLARWILMVQDRVGGDEITLTHEFLSMMLGVRRPSVTVATHVLEGTGSIRAKRGRFEIRDREKLIELAGDAYQTAEREYERMMGGV